MPTDSPDRRDRNSGSTTEDIDEQRAIVLGSIEAELNAAIGALSRSVLTHGTISRNEFFKCAERMFDGIGRGIAVTVTGVKSAQKRSTDLDEVLKRVIELLKPSLEDVARLNSLNSARLAEELELRLRTRAAVWKAKSFQWGVESHIAKVEAQPKVAEKKAENQPDNPTTGSVQVGKEPDASTRHVRLIETAKPGHEMAGDAVQIGEQREAVIAKVDTPVKYKFLSTPEAALHFGVKPRTIYRWRAEGKLKAGPKRGTITTESVRRLQRTRRKTRTSEKDL